MSDESEVSRPVQCNAMQLPKQMASKPTNLVGNANF